MRNVRFGEDARCVHHGEQGLIGSSEVTFEKRAIGDHAVDGTSDSRITEKRLGSLHPAFGRRARTLAGLEGLLFSNALEAGELFLYLLVLPASLEKRDFGGSHLFPEPAAFLAQFLAVLL